MKKSVISHFNRIVEDFKNIISECERLDCKKAQQNAYIAIDFFDKSRRMYEMAYNNLKEYNVKK